MAHLNILQLLLSGRPTAPRSLAPSPQSPPIAPLVPPECAAGYRWVGLCLDDDAPPIPVAVPLGPVDPASLFRVAPSPSPTPSAAALIDSMLC